MKYGYKTKHVRCVDGDTVVLLIDHGLNVYTQQVIRLARVNTPELKDPDPQIKEKAKQAAQALTAFMRTMEFCAVDVLGRDPYGRWVANVTVAGKDASDWLIENGYGVRV